jgi:uncharacterized damage-inducible protein DinB
MSSHLVSRALRAIVPLALAIGCMPPAARAQDALDAKSAVHVRDVYLADLDTLHAKVLALAIAIPEDKYTWRPAAGVRSISEVLTHVVHEFYFSVPTSVGGSPPADFGNPRAAESRLAAITTKSQVLDELAKSWSHTWAQVGAVDAAHLTGTYKPWGTTIDKAVLLMAGDLHEHLGQLSSYARMNGVKPPWSK